MNRKEISAERQRLQRLKNALDNLIPTLDVAMDAYIMVAGPGEIHLPPAAVNRYAQVRLPVIAEVEPLRQQLDGYGTAMPTSMTGSRRSAPYAPSRTWQRVSKVWCFATRVRMPFI